MFEDNKHFDARTCGIRIHAHCSSISTQDDPSQGLSPHIHIQRTATGQNVSSSACEEERTMDDAVRMDKANWEPKERSFRMSFPRVPRSERARDRSVSSFVASPRAHASTASCVSPPPLPPRLLTTRTMMIGSSGAPRYDVLMVLLVVLSAGVSATISKATIRDATGIGDARLAATRSPTALAPIQRTLSLASSSGLPCSAHRLIHTRSARIASGQALVDIYNATNGARWGKNTNWLNGDPCTMQWFGVTCEQSLVTQLYVRYSLQK